MHKNNNKTVLVILHCRHLYTKNVYKHIILLRGEIRGATPRVFDAIYKNQQPLRFEPTRNTPRRYNRRLFHATAHFHIFSGRCGGYKIENSFPV